MYSYVKVKKWQLLYCNINSSFHSFSQCCYFLYGIQRYPPPLLLYFFMMNTSPSRKWKCLFVSIGSEKNCLYSGEYRKWEEKFHSKSKCFAFLATCNACNFVFRHFLLFFISWIGVFLYFMACNIENEK